MTRLLHTALILFILSSCSAQEETVEDALYQCLLEHYELKGINLPATLDSLEDYLIAEDILINKEGSGKIRYYEDVISSGVVPQSSETALMKTIRDAYIDQEQLLICLKQSPYFDSLEYHQSDFARTTQKILDDAVFQGTTSPVRVSKAFVTHLDESDFEHPLYRAQMLLSFVMTNERKKAYIEQTPSTAPITEITPGGFSIEITSSGAFVANMDSLSKEELETALGNYLSTFDESTYIQLIVSKKTPYKQFSIAQQIISNGYKTLWNQVSLKEHKKAFDTLDDFEKNEIKSRYPIRVREVIN